MRMRIRTLLAATLALSGWLWLNGAMRADEPPPPAPESGVDVQARGPVHEAFAQPGTDQVEKGPLVAKQPPDPIDEQPPDQKPDGDDVRWIPGYWAWDDTSNDYIWISGFWRDIPPGRTWVPGHWQQLEGGWQWAAGFWANADQQEVSYVPSPPATLETGPSTPAPSADMIYTPGCWVWREARYYWRPGFWVEFRPGWVWCPAHYIWTPSGCIFVEGFWDYPLEQRGLLFAPCRFEVDFLRRHHRFVPSFVIQPDFLIGALFVGPRRHCYFFGDYFEERFARAGFVAWIDYRIGRKVYDPNYAYYLHRFHNDETWAKNLHELYVGRREGIIQRPPHTLAEQVKLVEHLRAEHTEAAEIKPGLHFSHLENASVLAPISRVHDVKVTNMASLGKVDNRLATEHHVIKMTEVTKEQREKELKVHADSVRKLQEQRHAEEERIIRSSPRTAQPTVPQHTIKIELPKYTHVTPPVSRVPNRTPLPPPPKLPQHEDRPIRK